MRASNQQGKRRKVHFRTLGWELDPAQEIVAHFVFVHRPGGKIIVSSLTYTRIFLCRDPDWNERTEQLSIFVQNMMRAPNLAIFASICIVCWCCLTFNRTSHPSCGKSCY